MAQRKKAKKQDEILVDISEVTGKAEDFYQKNQKPLLIGVAALVIIVGGWMAYKNLYAAPRQKEALSQMAQAEFQFERDSFAQALANPGGGFPGFDAIVKKYGSTPAGNAARYYAGISCLNLGQFDAAISYLDDFSPKGELLPSMKYGALGDAWAEKGDLDKALGFYKKAAAEGEGNEILQPYYLKKYALLSEKQGKPKEAVEAWETIKANFPQTPEARDAEKYIVRLQ